jgi:hypothetical protein
VNWAKLLVVQSVRDKQSNVEVGVLK